jgi:6-phospho-beta-glucosidase
MQTEGGWNEGGKGLSVYDIRPATETTMDWHVAIDNFHDFETDFDWMKAMNMNMYRFQISWSRVCPDGDGDFNEEGIEFYSQMIDSLLARGIEPMICLYHFDMPLALAEKYNGFIDRHVMAAFVRYGKEMMQRFSNRVKWWLVFNEHNLYFTDEAFNISGYQKGERTISELYTIFHHTMLAHKQISAFLHETSDAKIGGMLAYTAVYPASNSPKDNLAVTRFNEFVFNNLNEAYTNGHYLESVLAFVKTQEIDMDWQTGDDIILARTTEDFIAFSYYRSCLLDASRITEEAAPNSYMNKGFKADENLPANEWGWSIDPDGFRNIMTTIYNRYKLPLFPVENGLGQREVWDGQHEIQDDLRISYHRQHILAMKDAMNDDGIKVLGYLGWGLIDIPSSQGDMEKRYGAIYVNRGNHELRDMKRVPKKSSHWFKKVFQSNGEVL